MLLNLKNRMKTNLGLKRKVTLYSKVNWIKTLYFNFKMFPFSIAIKVPVFFYGKIKFSVLKGKIIINAPIKTGMIGFGQPYEAFTTSAGKAELYLAGTLSFEGHTQFGKDSRVYIAENAYCQMGEMSSIGSNGKIFCYNKIIFGNYCRIGFESQLMDTNSHQMINTVTGEKYPMTAPIILGNYNYFGNRISIMQNTKTPNYCTIASNSVCNKDYTQLGENILIGGVPSKLLKENISRDWSGEQEQIEKWLKI